MVCDLLILVCILGSDERSKCSGESVVGLEMTGLNKTESLNAV